MNNFSSNDFFEQLLERLGEMPLSQDDALSQLIQSVEVEDSFLCDDELANVAGGNSIPPFKKNMF